MKDSGMKLDDSKIIDLYTTDSLFNRVVDCYYFREKELTLLQFIKNNLSFLLYKTLMVKQEQINDIRDELIMTPEPIKMQVGRKGEEND